MSPSSKVISIMLLLVAVVPLHAQYPLALSIDSVVEEADLVVIGRVSAGADGDARGAIDLVVEKVLKGGDRQGSLNLPISSWEDLYTGNFSPDAPIDTHRLLVALRHDASKPDTITAIDLDAPNLAVMRADLVILKTPAEVIQAAEDEVRRLPPGGQRVKSAALYAPGSNIKGDPFYGDRIIIPVDDRLENRAHAILSGEREGQRSEAVEDLKYFKSDENIHLLRSLLNDPDQYVRRYAGLVLKGWGVEEATPDPVQTKITSYHSLAEAEAGVEMELRITSVAPSQKLVTGDTTIYKWDQYGSYRVMSRVGLFVINVEGKSPAAVLVSMNDLGRLCLAKIAICP